MLPQAFFDGDTVEIARLLVGKYLVRQYGGVTLAARITETEAYVGRVDKACHAYNYRKTERTKTLFAPPGTAYVYLIYGMHCCLNFVTEREGEPAAVLIRGGEAEHLEKKRQLWNYIRTSDPWVYKKLRWGLFGIVMNLPGAAGRAIAVAAYKISQKVVGFN